MIQQNTPSETAQQRQFMSELPAPIKKVMHNNSCDRDPFPEIPKLKARLVTDPLLVFGEKERERHKKEKGKKKPRRPSLASDK